MAKNPYAGSGFADFYMLPSPGKILKKIKGSGHSFLSKHPWVGDCLELAEEILSDQDDFEKSFQETYVKSKKLIESAAQLAESKECDPQDIKAKASFLESEVKNFTAKLKKRRELLKMAVNFYKNSQKLAKATDKLKEEVNLEGAEPQNFDEHLEKHRNDCESTLEKILATVHDGQILSSQLLQEGKVPEKDSRTSFFSHGSHSVEHSRQAVESHLKELNQNRQQLEKLWRGRQKKLDYWVKVKHYERDTNTLYLDVSKWNSSWQKKELSADVNKAVNLVKRFEDEYKDLAERFTALIEEGKQLEELLNTSGVEVLITLKDAKVDSRQHIAHIIKQSGSEFSVVKKIHHSLKVKYDFSIKQRKLEADAKKVSGWIRHGESILQASQEAGFSMFEAEALLREYERFHNAIETTRLGVLDIKTNAEKLKADGHQDYITIMNISENVDSKWKTLMQHAEERRAVVFSSYNFYRAAEQIGKLLEKFSKDCRSEEDPCAVFSSYELRFRREKIEALMKQSEPERKAVEDGCLKVKDSSQEFLKHVLPSSDGNQTPVIEGTVGRLEITVQDLVEQVTSQEAFVLKQIQLRKNVLANCAEFVTFEEEVTQTLSIIQEQGTVLSEGFNSLQNEAEETQTVEGEDQQKTHLEKEEEYRTMFIQIRDGVKKLLKQASDHISRIHYHRVAISELATSIDKRYKDLEQVMKQYRESLEKKLETTLPAYEDEEEWPSLSVFELTNTDLKVARRDVSHDSGIHEISEEKRRSVKRIEFIIKELIQTERAYVDDMKCCIDNFLTPMYSSPDLPNALRGASDIIFGNIEHIHEFHSKVFLRELVKYEKCPENVGNCFIEWADKFHMYVDFCANKPDSNSLLIEHGETFFEDLQQKKNLGLSLAAYLIKPVQRITKYQLLLKDLLSCCDDVDGSLQAGLDVMLSVPRRANDAMYLCLIKGFDEQGSLETLGKILLQDSFTIFDPKHILKKAKERHVFLFEQALLFCKENKDTNGKCTFEFKTKLKTSEMGITEYMAEDKCKFAVWTGAPPYTEEKRIIKAESEEVKHMWVKEIRNLTQQFQFGLLQARASFYPTSPRKRGNRKSTSQADISFSSDTYNNDRALSDCDTATICSRLSLDNSSMIVTDRYIVTDDFTPKPGHEHEIALIKGQTVDILGRPPGSASWRVRIMDSDVTGDAEGLVPFNVLKKIEESPLRNKRSSVETLHSQSSEDSFATDSPKGSNMSISGDSSSKSNRRRTKSNININSLKMRTWSKGTAKKYQQMAAMQKPPLPMTPSRRGTASGGGSKKLQALLGAPESDIDLLIRTGDTPDGKYATLGRQPSGSGNAERVKFLHANEPEDAGFQEGDYDSEGDSMSDSNESYTSSVKGDSEERAVLKRMTVLRELIKTENDYINDLELIELKYRPAFLQRDDIPEELKNRDRIIFGNLTDILDFHKGTLIKDLQQCESTPENLPNVFLKSEKKFEHYIQYCANKPRSATLIHDHLPNIFADISNQLQLKSSLDEYLMKPISRIMNYHTVLKDYIKYTQRAGLNTDLLFQALHVMQSIPKKSDDVMNIGMLEGFKDNLNEQGKLLIQDTLYVANAKLQEASSERRVFLFEQMVIFCEPFERKTNLKAYMYQYSIETHTLGLTQSSFDDDPCKLAIWSKKEDGSSDIYVMAAQNATAKKTWIDSIRRILEDQHGKGINVNSRLGPPKAVTKALKSYRKVSRQSIGSNSSFNSDDIQLNGGGGGRPQLTDKMGKIIPSLQHVNLVPLDQLKGKKGSNEDLSKPTIEHKRYMVTENYQALSSEELSVHKGEIVYLIHRDKKSATFYRVRSFTKEREGLVPSKILHKSKEKNEGDSKVKRQDSVGGGDKKDKKDKAKKSKVNSGTLLRTASLKRKKKEKEKLNGEANTSNTEKPVLDTLHHHWQSNFDSSDDDAAKEANAKAAEKLQHIIHRDPKSTFEVAPEFKILPRDVTVEVATHVKLTCTVLANPTPNVIWTKNDHIELQSGDKYQIDFKNSMCTLEILSTEVSDTGTYTVTASNNLGTASYSAKITVRGENKPGAPSKPFFTSVTPTSLDIRWYPPSDIDNCPVSGYTVQYQVLGSSTWQMAVAACHDTRTTVENLIAGKSYRFLVTAHNNQGNSVESEPSDPICVGDIASPRRNVHEIKWREKVENHYQICGELGRGRFSIVKRCVEKSTNKEYAAKIVRRRMVKKETVESEVAILQELNHSAIVSLHEIYDAPNGLVLVEQLLTGGRLFDHIVIMDNLTEQIAVRHVKELLLAISYLHKNNIAHLDVKPENILLTGGESPSVVVSDFGDAVRINKRVPYQHELSGNPEFAAPEIVSGDTISLATDMWSVGVVVFVLLGGVSPFYSDNRERACANVTEIRYTFPDDFFAEISDEAKDFIEELLVRDQTSRPDADECLNFAWMKMTEPRKIPIELSRLAAFNARRRYQYESNNQSNVTSSQLLSSPQKKGSTNR
ncbi:kalirin-like isoform X10 [Clytia hemisphaerica]|uniref:kalirin-like isoform X10 n=1 Tax=Clytia hemisphaerica TaxID=252671 RepID=UPI0034D5476F